MILAKLQDALAEVDTQRKALNEVETQLRIMIAKLTGGGATSPNPASTRTFVSHHPNRDRLDEIVDILREEGKPTRIEVIAERLSERLGKKVDRTKIEPGLNRHIQKVKQKRIDKFAPSTYGLPEWKTVQAA